MIAGDGGGRRITYVSPRRDGAARPLFLSDREGGEVGVCARLALLRGLSDYQPSQLAA